MNISKALQTLQTLSNKITAEEQFPIFSVLQKTAAVLEVEPHDKTALGLKQVLQAKAAHGQIFISRNDLRQIYNKYFSPETNIKNALASELKNAVPQKPQKNDTRQSRLELTIKEAAQKFVDPTLLHQLEKLASPKESSSLEKNISQQCQKYCSNEMNRIGVASQVSFLQGHDNLALCQASFSTPKGTTNFIIPLEVIEQKPITPTFFLCNSGLIELSEKNIKLALNKHAGEKLNFLPDQLLKTFAAVKKNNQANMSEVERIVIQSKLMTSKPHVDGIVGLPMPEPKKEFEFKVPLSKEAQSIAKSMAHPYGVAEFQFGASKVKTGAKLVDQSLTKLGYKRGLIEVASSDQEKVFYKVSLNGVAPFRVPVKLSSVQPEIPTLMISEDGVSLLSSENIASLSPSLQTMASFSSLNEKNDSELKEEVYNAMLNKKASVAEEALQILHSRNSSELKGAFEMYLQGMQGTLKPLSTCSKPIKVANSIHVLCGHLRVPLHKVYQDEFGNCCHLARKHIAKPETAAMAAHRIIL